MGPAPHFASKYPMPALTESLIRPVHLMMLCGLLLSACAPWPPREDAPLPKPEPPPAPAVVVLPAPPPAPAATPADLATREMLAFQEHARQLAPADLAKEIARFNDAPVGPRAGFELAVLLAQTRSNGDLARALGLLDGVLRSTAPEAAPLQPLARLVAARLTEQRRLEEQLERQSQQARENQRKIEQLNEKLEALKAIERSLTTRPAASAAPSASVPATKASAP